MNFTTDTKLRFAIRPGFEANAPMAGYFDIEGVGYVAFLNDKAEVTIHRLKADNTPYKAAEATGTVKKATSNKEKAPSAKGIVRTKEGSYSISLWAYSPERDPFYSVELERMPERHGSFFTF